MKTLIMAIAILLAGSASFAQAKMGHGHHQNSGMHYTCTMHPEVMKHHPGKCPKCGMKLVAVKKMKRMEKDKSMGDMKM